MQHTPACSSHTSPSLVLYNNVLTQVKADSVPQFYFPGGKPVPSEVREQALAKIDDLFRSSPDGLAVPAVRELVKEVSK